METPVTLEEIRIIADLRILHAKVFEVFQACNMLRSRHTEKRILQYADQAVVQDDIKKMQLLYQWFMRIQNEILATKGGMQNGEGFRRTLD